MIPYRELESENKKLKSEALKNQRLHSAQTKMLTEELVEAKLRLKVFEKELILSNDSSEELINQMVNVERYGAFVNLFSRLYPNEYKWVVKEFNTRTQIEF